MERRPIFPFSALLGQTAMKRALALNAINPRIGGVLLRGEKGTAKSTAVRAFARLLPEITVVEGCPFSCDPDGSDLCEDCEARRTRGETLPRSRRPVRVVELPVGATEDRVIGSLELERAIKAGEKAFEPGLLAAAHRGILYVDEVNLLGDHLVDALLDVAAMGQNFVEREGVSVRHPAEFLLIGTMNPEEGELRPQLLDRFGLCVEVTGMSDPQERAEVVRRRIAFEAGPEAFGDRWRPADAEEAARIVAAQALLSRVQLSDALLTALTTLCAELGVDGLRGDIVAYKAAVALAAYAGRTEVLPEDIREAAALALQHRRRRQPFDPAAGHEQDLQQLLDQHFPENDRPQSPEEPDDGASGPPPPQILEPSAPIPLPRSARPPDSRLQARQRSTPSGRHPGSPNNGTAGRYVRAQLPHGPLTAGNLALDATLRAAAPLQALRRAAVQSDAGPLVLLRPSDLREKVRQQRTPHLVLFVIDASGSMAARRRMAAAKGAVLSLLLEAYQQRDQVGLIAFQGTGAALLLPPTNSVALAERSLRLLPTGGRTPLAHGLRLAIQTLEQLRARQPAIRPWVVLVSDGRPNVALTLTSADALADTLAAARQLRALAVRTLVVDTESGPMRLGLSRIIARTLGGEYVQLQDVAPGSLTALVRERLPER